MIKTYLSISDITNQDSICL